MNAVYTMRPAGVCAANKHRRCFRAEFKISAIVHHEFTTTGPNLLMCGCTTTVSHATSVTIAIGVSVQVITREAMLLTLLRVLLRVH